MAGEQVKDELVVTLNSTLARLEDQQHLLTDPAPHSELALFLLETRQYRRAQRSCWKEKYHYSIDRQEVIEADTGGKLLLQNWDVKLLLQS